jgi:hypothetical protein
VKTCGAVETGAVGASSDIVAVPLGKWKKGDGLGPEAFVQGVLEADAGLDHVAALGTLGTLIGGKVAVHGLMPGLIRAALTGSEAGGNLTRLGHRRSTR